MLGCPLVLRRVALRDLTVVNIVSDDPSSRQAVASTGIDTFDLLSVPVFRLVRLYKANL